MKAIVAIGLITMFGLSGCAELVERRYDGEKGGTVKYTKELFMTEKNRAKALDMANDYCSPRRAILVSESDRAELTGNSSSTTENYGKRSYTNTTAQTQQTVYINFRCGKGKAVARR
jgi:uncharacterized protein YceK